MEEERECPLCHRELGRKNISKHHLIPKSQGGKHSEVIWLHNICHQKIHSLFTEKELKKHFYTIELLLEQEAIQTFVKWVVKKDPSYYERNARAKRRK